MLRVFVVLAVFAAVVLNSGCPSYATLAPEMRQRVSQTHEGQLFFLKQSLYVGQFYDDDRFLLVHPRRFDELTYLQNAEGEALPPPPATGVIPAGTRVRIEKIEWPTSEVVFRRPLYTPRYTTWIVLRVAEARGRNVTVEREGKHILLTPGGITDDEVFSEWVNRTLSVEDNNPWLLSLPEAQQFAIAGKRAMVGMSDEALNAALGFADTRVRDDNGREVAVYGAVSIVLERGVVVAVNDPRAKPAAKPTPKPAAAQATPAAPATPEAAATTPASPDGQDGPVSPASNTGSEPPLPTPATTSEPSG